jgi:hypothetical protein
VGVRVLPALVAESCAVLVATNGKVKNTNSKFHFTLLGFHDTLRDVFP